jgi:predicted dehydrogenase
MRQLRVGVIGANWSLVGHLPAWRNIQGVEVLAICTAHEESARRAAAENGVPKAFWDYRAMVEDLDLDIIDVGTRPSLRYDMVMRSIAAGKHVLNANPFATDLASAREMLSAQRSAGVVGAVEAQFPWVPQISRMKELIDEGFLGDLYGVDCRCQFPLIRNGEAIFPFVTRPGYTSSYDWLGDTAVGASALRNLGGHALHALVYLFGEVDSVSASLATHVKEWRWDDGSRYTPRTVDTAAVTVRFAGGGIGQLNTSWVVADARGFALEAFGSNGRLRLESQTGFPDATNTVLYGAPAMARGMSGQGERVMEIPDRLWSAENALDATARKAPVVVPLTRMFGHIVGAIRGGGDALPGFAQACHVQAICEAAETSDRTGARVAVPAIGT